MGIRQRFHDIRRARRILQVAVRYGFGYIIDRLHVEHSIIGRKILTSGTVAIAEEPPAVRLRKLLEELGPTFIKFGQVLSMRSDILPAHYTQELARLQDEVSPFECDAVERIIESELGAPVHELFRSFALHPKASASLAQVHEARLASGEDVVVKVQRPGIEETITSDIEILYELAHLAHRYIEETRLFNPEGIVDEFKRTILREIDFTIEAANIDRFRENFRGDEGVCIPRVFHRFVSRRVLALENVTGIKITEAGELAAAGLDTRQIARNGADALLKQVFLHGLFHADPHAGNIFVGPNNRIIFLDFGMVGHISEQMRADLSDMLIGFINRDVSSVRDAFIALGAAGENVDTVELDAELEDFVYRYHNRPLKELNMGRLLLNMMRIVVRHRIRLPPDLFLLSKVLITIDGIGRKLDNDFNLVEQARPFVQELQRRKFSAPAIARDARNFAKSLFRFTRALPRDLSVIFGKLKQGTLKVEFEHRGLEGLTTQIDKASSRISLSLITAALIIGSSIITHANFGVRYLGYPVLGLVGFMAAGIMGVWLIVVIISTGRM
jgi:ubiquinone biosynthesis protein